jgi:hypothetical protein
VTPTEPAVSAASTISRTSAPTFVPVPPLGLRSAPTSAARLAEATGATVSYDEATGAETVSFPHPSDAAAFAPAVELMRAPDHSTESGEQGVGEAAAEGAAPAQAAAPEPQPSPSAGGGGGGDIDEIYDQVIQRLRRDLLADRERMGDLLGDLP